MGMPFSSGNEQILYAFPIGRVLHVFRQKAEGLKSSEMNVKVLTPKPTFFLQSKQTKIYKWKKLKNSFFRKTKIKRLSA